MPAPTHSDFKEIIVYRRVAHVVFFSRRPVVQVDIVDKHSVSYALALRRDGMFKVLLDEREDKEELLRVPAENKLRHFIEEQIYAITHAHRVKEKDIFFHLSHKNVIDPDELNDIPVPILPRCWFKKKILDQARQVYRDKTISDEEKWFTECVEEALQHALDGRFRKAEKNYKEIIHRLPDDPEGYRLLAEHYLNYGENEKARAVVKTLMEKFSLSSKDIKMKLPQFSRLLQKSSPVKTKPDSTAGVSSTREPPESDFKVPVIIRLDQKGVRDLKKAENDHRFTPLTHFRLIVEGYHASLMAGFDILLGLADSDLIHLDYQMATVRYVMRQLAGRGMLSDEVGLGKTIEAGMILKEYIVRGLVKNCLLLVPASLVIQWQEELQMKFHLSAEIYSPKHTPSSSNMPSILIASLNTAKREPHRRRLLETQYDMVVIDEAHRLKARTTSGWKFVNELHSRFLLMLTATPVQNAPEELYNLLTLIKPGLLKTPAEFRKRYLDPKNPRRFRNETDLKEVLAQVMVRNTRANTGLKLPERIAHLHPVEIYPPEKEIYLRLTDYIRKIYPCINKTLRQNIMMTVILLQKEVGSSMRALTGTLAKILARPGDDFPRRDELADIYRDADAIEKFGKVDHLVRLLSEIPDKVLVFTEYRGTLNLLHEQLSRNGIPAAVFHGGLSSREKERQVEDFRRQRRVLISLQSGAEGRNLQFCHYMINFDLPWNPMKIEQRIGRLHRIGQTQPVTIYNLACPDTVEAYILKLLDEKINMFQMVIGEMEMIIGDIEGEEPFDYHVFRIWADGKSPSEIRRGFEQLGQQMLDRKKSYQETRELDDRIFRENFALG